MLSIGLLMFSFLISVPVLLAGFLTLIKNRNVREAEDSVNLGFLLGIYSAALEAPVPSLRYSLIVWFLVMIPVFLFTKDIIPLCCNRLDYRLFQRRRIAISIYIVMMYILFIITYLMISVMFDAS